jgi:hypothetical protein
MMVFILWPDISQKWVDVKVACITGVSCVCIFEFRWLDIIIPSHLLLLRDITITKLHWELKLTSDLIKRLLVLNQQAKRGLLCCPKWWSQILRRIKVSATHRDKEKCMKNWRFFFFLTPIIVCISSGKYHWRTRTISYREEHSISDYHGWNLIT